MSCPKPERVRGFNLPASVLCQRRRRAFNLKNLPSGQLLSGGDKSLPTGRTSIGGSAKLLPTGRDLPLFVYGSLEAVVDFGGTNLAFANDDTNVVAGSQGVTTDPVSGDVYVVYYRSTGGVLCVAKQTGGVGAFVITVSTATVVGLTDNHLYIACCVDSTGRLNIAWGMHSDQMNYWRAPNPGDTLVTDATKLVSPVGAGPGPGTGLVTGNTASEAAATYPFFLTYTDGQVAFLWRTGGSSLGNQALYNINGTTITSVSLNFLEGVSSGASFYLNTPCCEPANSAHPNRLWISFQIRDTTDPLTAHDLWVIYSDDRGVTWNSFNGTPMTLPMTPSNIGAALAYSIPSGTQNYNPAQAMAVELDGTPIVVEYHGGPPLAQLYAHRCKPDGTVITAQISNWQVSDNYDFISQPTAVTQDGQIIAFFGARTTNDNVGKITAIVASGAAFEDTYQQTVVFVNGFNSSKQSPIPFNYQAWQKSKRLQLLHIRTGLSGTTAPNGPFLLDTTISLAGPPAVETPQQTLGSLAYWHDAINYVPGTWPDLSGNARDATNPTPANQPSFNANQINGLPSVHGDGSNDALSITCPLVAPGTTPFFRCMIVRVNTWTLNRQLTNGGVGSIILNPSSPTLRLNNGVANLSINPGANAVWRMVFWLEQNTTADYFQVGEARASGVSPGNGVSGTTFLFGTSLAGANACDGDIAEQWAYQGTAPTFDQIGKMIRYATNKYGPTIMG